MKILKVENLSKIYGKGDAKVIALNDISFEVEEGEFLAIIGPSGSGKSTLLHTIAGLEKPTSGKVYFYDKNMYEMNKKDLTILRRQKIGIIYQFYNLIPTLNVEENITLPIELDKKKIDKDEDEISFNIYGIDITAKYTRILDKNDKNIISLLDDKNGIIVNENAKELYGLEINDKIKFKYQDLILEYTIIGFNNELMGKTGYVERVGLTDKLHVSNNSYSMIYSNNSKYKNMNELTQDEASSISYLLSVDDLKANI